MMKINNYKDYDTLTLYVKKNKLKEIIENYQIFGWELVKEQENDRYEDIVDLTFTRPHKIANKDELQLQQVYMEEKLNELGKLERHKHSKTTSIGLCFGTLALAFIIIGVLVALKTNSVTGLVGGIVVAIVGVLLIVVECIILFKLYKNETTIYEQRHNDLESELFMITKTVTELTGGEYGQD
ncbi:MAG: hypothetical protein IJ358_03950 [Clostridia bacterium]|nr:hypothetical protein [Clostridia bacterium]